ncbi:hypothetical protein ACFL23_02255 [Patescibacteria group bacterium]
MKKISSQKGAILVMAVLIMSMVVIIGITIGTIVLNQLKQAKQADSSIIAYYAADSASESALYKLRKLGITPTVLNATDNAGTFVGNGASWTRNISGTQNYSTFLGVNESMILDLYDADLNCGQVQCIDFVWDDVLDADEPDPNLELTFYSLDTSGGIEVLPSSGSQQIYYFGAGDENPNTARKTNLPSNICHTVRIKALANVAHIEEIKTYSDVACTVRIGIPSYLTINSLGTYKDSSQRLNTLVFKKSPLSGIFEYALFSEGDIVK